MAANPCAGLPDGEVRSAFETRDTDASQAVPKVRPDAPQQLKPVGRSLPRPSEFAIGRPVPPAILATERAVLARLNGSLKRYVTHARGLRYDFERKSLRYFGGPDAVLDGFPSTCGSGPAGSHLGAVFLVAGGAFTL